MNHCMPVSLFRHRPERCPYGHPLTLGEPQLVGWRPCICPAAQAAYERGEGGLGHLWISCDRCSDEGRDVVYYEPPCDANPGSWPAETSV